jgi:excinuclease ABC subunit C
VNNQIKDKLKELPKSAGVYFHKDKTGETIYIGKAAVLRNRVRQYFQKSRRRDPKTEALVAEIADVEWIEVETELDALFLEAEMIRRYLPRYNILLRDDKSLLYVRIDSKSDYPTLTYTRRPLDDGAEYFGPFLQAYALKKALRLLRRIFPYATTRSQATMGSKLYEQIGLDPGLATGKTSLEEYRKNLRRLMSYLRGNRVAIIREIEEEMKMAANKQDFERAAALRNKLYELKSLRKQIVFSDREFMDISKDKGLQGLSDVLGIEVPKRIEGFDISHMSGTDTVASMVVFSSGIPEKAAYRKFKMRLKGNNDFAHMHEALHRRLSPKNNKQWGLPNLILIDGGKGQLAAATKARNERGLSIPMIGLAKREEEIVIQVEESNVNCDLIAKMHQQIGGTLTQTTDFWVLRLPEANDIVKLLQRIRDESHRFAVSYHTVLKRGRQTKNWLDEVPGVGPATKRTLLRTFGSSRGVLQTRFVELEACIGEKKAAIVDQYRRAEKKEATP